MVLLTKLSDAHINNGPQRKYFQLTLQRWLICIIFTFILYLVLPSIYSDSRKYCYKLRNCIYKKRMTKKLQFKAEIKPNPYFVDNTEIEPYFANDESFLRQMEAKGFEYRFIKNDGNSLYRCLAHFTDKP